MRSRQPRRTPWAWIFAVAVAAAVIALASAPAAAADEPAGGAAAGGARAAQCDTSPPPTGVLRACYYRGIGRGREFLGSLDEAALTSPVPNRVFAIDHRWGTGPVFDGVTPANGGAENDVTVTWRGSLEFTGGDYHLSVLNSGEPTLMIDGRRQTLELWEVVPERRTKALRIDAGVHEVVLTWTMKAELNKDTRMRLHWDRVPTATPAQRSRLRVDAFILTSQDLCIGGNPWRDGSPVVLHNADGSINRAWQVDSAHGWPLGFVPGDPVGDTMPQVECFTTGFTAEEIDRIERELRVFARTVRSWSFGALNLDVRVHRLSGPATLERINLGFVVGPWSLGPLAAPIVTTATDFVVAFTPNRELATGRYFDWGLWGGTYGVDLGIGGASYSWIGTPHDALIVLHEWQHQLTYAVRYLLGFQSIYPDYVSYPGTGYPACGQGAADTFAWFPDSHEAEVEPDSPWCGMSKSDTGVPEMHVLSHLDRSLRHYPLGRIVGNHCRDGVMDYDETGVDVGGKCSPGAPVAPTLVQPHTSIMFMNPRH